MPDPTQMPSWAPLEKRGAQFRQRRLNEILPMLEKAREVKVEEIAKRDRKHGGEGPTSIRVAAVERKARFIKQSHLLDDQVASARIAVARGDDASVATILATSGAGRAASRCGVQVGSLTARATSPSKFRSAEAVAPRLQTPPLITASYAVRSPKDAADLQMEYIRTLPSLTSPSRQGYTDQTPRSVAVAYAADAARRHGETYVLPALHVPKIKLSTNPRKGFAPPRM